MFQRSGACYMCLGCFRGVMRVACDWDIEKELCVLFVSGMFKRSGACCLCLEYV